MAEKISGNPNAGKLLNYLYRRHLFTERRVGNEETYQYHSLFRDFLLSRLRKAYPQLERDRLATQAAALLEAEHYPQDALALYCETKDWESGTRLILAEADGLIAQGRWETLKDWIGLLPAAHVDNSPWLVYWLGTALTPIHQAQARASLCRSLALFESQDDLTGHLAVAGIIVTLFVEEGISPNWDKWIDPLERLIARIDTFPSSAVELAVHSALQLATQYMRPDHPLLQSSVLRVLALMDEDNLDVNRRVQAAIFLLQYFATTGDVELARRLICKMDGFLEAPEVTALNQSAALAFRGWCQHVLLTESEQALPVLKRAEAIAKEHGLVQAQAHSNEFLGYVHLHLRGDLTDGEAALDRLAAIGFGGNSNRLAGYHLSQMRLCQWRGNVRRARDHAERCQEAAIRNGPAFRVFFCPQVVQAFADSGEYERGLALIHEIRALLPRTCYECFDALLVLEESYVAFCRGEVSLCHQLLRDSLLLAQRDTRRAIYVRWMGPGLAVIFAEALRAGIEANYVQSLIRQWGVSPPSAEMEAWPWPVKVYTLGRFEIERDGKPLTFAGKAPKKSLALLRAIIAASERDVCDYQLIDALWREEDSNAGRNAFMMALHRLRSLLGGAETIEFEKGRLKLSPSRCWVDAFAFESMLDKSCIPAGPNESEIRSRTVSLYRGPFLPGDTDEPWATAYRERLRGKFVHCVRGLGKHFEADSDWERAIEVYLRGLDADSLIEEFYQGLMRCYSHLNRPAEGLAVFRRLRQTFSVTLGIKPSSVSQTLYQSLLKQPA